MSERKEGLGLGMNIGNKIKGHKRALLGTVGGMALIGGVAATYVNRDIVTNLFSNDKGAEVSGYLQAQGMKDFNFDIPREANTIRVICPETDIYSDELKLAVVEKAGNIASVSVLIPITETVTYLGADGEQIHAVSEQQDPIRYQLEKEQGQEALEKFISATNRCNP